MRHSRFFMSDEKDGRQQSKAGWEDSAVLPAASAGERAADQTDLHSGLVEFRSQVCGATTGIRKLAWRKLVSRDEVTEARLGQQPFEFKLLS